MAIDRLKAMVRGTALEEPLKVLLAPLIRPFRTEWVRRAHRDDKAMRRLLKRVLRPDSNVVDVGCNVGEFLEQVRRHAPRGTHVAVEPLPHLAEALAARTLEKLGTEWHGTTANGAVTIEPVYCLGLCACGPAAMVDDKVVGRVDDAKMAKLLAEAGV